MNASRRPSLLAARARSGGLALAVWLLAGCGADPVDPVLVGTWEIPGAAGTSWRLTIDEDGRYAFTNAGVGTAPSHSGEFSASAGEWSLRDAAGAIEDRGTYALVAGALQLTGNRGSLQWGRAAQQIGGELAGASAGTAPATTAGAAAVDLVGALGDAASVPAAAPAPAAASPVSAAAASQAPTLPEIIDPCLLVTEQEASNLLDVTVATKRTTPQPRTQNDCFYSGSGRTLSVTSSNGGGLDAAGYLEQRRARGEEPLPGIGDGAYLAHQRATGLTSVHFVIGRASFELLASGIPLERADPGLRQLAAQAAARARTPAGAFRVPGTAGFAGTWMVQTSVGSMRGREMMFTVAPNGDLEILTTGGRSGTLVLEGAKWRIDDPFSATPLAGEYRLGGDRLSLGGAELTAELERVACRQAPRRVRPPYDFTRDIAGMLSGARNGPQPTPAPGSFDPKLAGLWEGEGKLNTARSQFLVSIDSRSTIVLAAFPTITGKFQANDGKFTLAIDGSTQASGTYQFAGGIRDGTIRMEDESGEDFTWTPYDPSYRPTFEQQIRAACN
jgi:hypothetical protein